MPWSMPARHGASDGRIEQRTRDGAGNDIGHRPGTIRKWRTVFQPFITTKRTGMAWAVDLAHDRWLTGGASGPARALINRMRRREFGSRCSA